MNLKDELSFTPQCNEVIEEEISVEHLLQYTFDESLLPSLNFTDHTLLLAVVDGGSPSLQMHWGCCPNRPANLLRNSVSHSWLPSANPQPRLPSASRRQRSIQSRT